MGGRKALMHVGALSLVDRNAMAWLKARGNREPGIERHKPGASSCVRPRHRYTNVGDVSHA